MNKSILKGTLLGGLSILIFAVLAVGGYKVLHRPKVAEVVAVKEVTETVMTPREECRDIQVRQRAPVNDSNRIAGTVLGGLQAALSATNSAAAQAMRSPRLAGPLAERTSGTRCKKACRTTTCPQRQGEVVKPSMTKRRNWSDTTLPIGLNDKEGL